LGVAVLMKRFDRKFGEAFLTELPRTPAVYLFRDEAGDVLYVGKAKDIRRRLAEYRNATRRKAHRKMRVLVREAAKIEVRPQPTETEALLVENELIRALRPPFNVDGAYDFLYPAIGTGLHEGRLVLCFTTEPERFDHLDLRWHGAFRPRWRARQAYDSFNLLFGHLGHAEPPSRLPALPEHRGDRLCALRRLPTPFLDLTRRFLDGEDDRLLAEVATELLESQGARLEAASVEEELRSLADFYRSDARRLREARISTGHEGTFVLGAERDGLFIRSRQSAAQTPRP